MLLYTGIFLRLLVCCLASHGSFILEDVAPEWCIHVSSIVGHCLLGYLLTWDLPVSSYVGHCLLVDLLTWDLLLNSHPWRVLEWIPSSHHVHEQYKPIGLFFFVSIFQKYLFCMFGKDECVCLIKTIEL